MRQSVKRDKFGDVFSELILHFDIVSAENIKMQ